MNHNETPLWTDYFNLIRGQLCFIIGGALLGVEKFCSAKEIRLDDPICSISHPLLTRLIATLLVAKGASYFYQVAFSSTEQQVEPTKLNKTNLGFFAQNELYPSILLSLQQKYVTLLKEQLDNLYLKLPRAEINNFKKQFKEKCTEIMSKNIDDDGKYLSISAYIQQIEQIHDMTDSSIQSVSL